MVTQVKGSVASQLESDRTTEIDNAVSALDTSDSYDLATATSLWTGSAISLDLSTVAGLDVTKPVFISSNLGFDDTSTLGTYTTIFFPEDKKLIHINPIAQTFPNLEYAFLRASGSTVTLDGKTERAGVEAVFRIIEVLQ